MRSASEIGRIKKLVESLCNKDFVDNNIPKFLYHFTDVENIPSILTNAHLYSRSYVESHGLMMNDNASSGVIDNTKSEYKDYVRFYFRPKTPTQYHNEGIKSKYRKYSLDAHCPIPVFLLFDSVNILSRADSRFCDQNLASAPEILKTVSDLMSFDFEKIYHLGAMKSEEKEILKAKRHAEVLIFSQCDLSDLKILCCRSTAEKETLINFLSDMNIQLNQQITVDNTSVLFQKERAYIDFVELEKHRFKIGFMNFDELTVEDELLIKLYNKEYEKERIYTNINTQFNEPITFNLDQKFLYYKLQLILNNKIIYYGEFIDDQDLPF